MIESSLPHGNRSTDVLIVGGGPAGLACAIALRQRGIDCVVVEAQGLGIDKACGEGLMPDTLLALAELGVAINDQDGYEFRGIRFVNSADCVEGRFRSSAGIGVRRPHLHGLLAERASAMGAQLLWNSQVALPEERADRIALVNGDPLGFRWLVGADGHASSVRRWAGLDAVRGQTLRYGSRTHYRVRPWSDCVEVHWAAGGQLYVTPVAADCVCVVFVTRDHREIARQHRGEPLLDRFPEVAERLRGAETISQQRGAVSATRTLRCVARDTVALCGDASGSIDSITGEGLAIAFRQAIALADAVAAGSLASYRQAHARIARLPRAMSSILLMLDRWPALEVRAIRALARRPELFGELLAAHADAHSLHGVLARRVPGLAWGLIAS